MGDMDRRRQKRVAVDLLCAVILPNGIKHAAMARNISTGGVFMECEKPLEKGDRVRVSLNLQMGGRLQKVEADSEIVHGPLRMSMTAFGVGARFLELEEQAQDLVERYVDARPEL